MAVELEEVVGGGDQPPFGADRAAAPASEAVQATVELHLREHGLDHWLAFAVELAATLGSQDAAHEVVVAAVPVAAATTTSCAASWLPSVATFFFRQPMIEPVFAPMKFNRGWTASRGARRGPHEWRLITATHNLLKLHRRALAAA